MGMARAAGPRSASMPKGCRPRGRAWAQANRRPALRPWRFSDRAPQQRRRPTMQCGLTKTGLVARGLHRSPSPPAPRCRLVGRRVDIWHWLAHRWQPASAGIRSSTQHPCRRSQTGSERADCRGTRRERAPSRSRRRRGDLLGSECAGTRSLRSREGAPRHARAQICELCARSRLVAGYSWL